MAWGAGDGTDPLISGRPAGPPEPKADLTNYVLHVFLQIIAQSHQLPNQNQSNQPSSMPPASFILQYTQLPCLPAHF